MATYNVTIADPVHDAGITAAREAYNAALPVGQAQGFVPSSPSRPLKLYAAIVLAVIAVSSLVAYATYLLIADRRGVPQTAAAAVPGGYRFDGER